MSIYNLAPNQLVTDNGMTSTFKSYNTIIAVKTQRSVTLDTKALEYSKTTLKYLKEFLDTTATKKGLQYMIDAGHYKTEELN